MYMYSTQLQGLDISSIPHGKNPLWKTVGTTIEIILSTESSLIFFYFLIFYPFVFQRKLSTNQQFLTIQELLCYLPPLIFSRSVFIVDITVVLEQLVSNC